MILQHTKRVAASALAAALAFSISIGARAADENPKVRLCKRDGKSLTEALGRAMQDASFVQRYPEHVNRLSQFEKACISGQGATELKSLPGYADVLAVHAQARDAFAKLKQKVDAAEVEEQQAAKARQAAVNQSLADADRKRAAELQEMRRKNEQEMAADRARAQAENRRYVEKRANELCTLKGQTSAICTEFFTTIEPSRAHEVEHESNIRSCLERLTGPSPDVTAAEGLLAANATSKYALECLRMMDIASGSGWRANYEARAKRAAFDDQLDQDLRRNFKAKCGVHASLRPGGGVLIERKSSSKATFLSRKDPDGDLMTILCSGVVVTRFPSGGTGTTAPTTEAALASDRDLRKCALEHVKEVPLWCPNGKVDFERGIGKCIRAAEAFCMK